jgi:hypothetical protein
MQVTRETSRQSAPPLRDRFANELAFIRRHAAEVAINRRNNDAPLRFSLHPTDGAERLLDLRRKPKTDLWVLGNLFTRPRARWRATDPFSHGRVPDDDPSQTARAEFVLPKNAI